MNVFTVVLLYPDYLADDFGSDVYVDSNASENYLHAVRVVQKRALEAQVDGQVEDPTDFRPILVLKGEVQVVADACSF